MLKVTLALAIVRLHGGPGGVCTMEFPLYRTLTWLGSISPRQNLRLAQDVAHLAYRLDAGRRHGSA